MNSPELDKTSWLNLAERLTEMWYPFGISGVLGVLSWWFSLSIPETKHEAILNGSLTFGAIVVGFLATSKTILISYRENPAFQKLNEGGYVGQMAQYLRSGILANLALCVFLILAMLCDGFNFTHFWVFLGSFSVLTFYRIVHLQLKLLTL